jgi:DNA-binding MarR family transcriptional regulator
MLLALRGHENYPEVTIRDLCDALQIRQSSTSLLVDRAVKRGLVDRREDPRDRRQVALSLTAQGQELLDRVMEGNRADVGALHFADLGLRLREALE